MKTRLGFVSNSSSSSFVMLTTEDGHLTALAQLCDEDRKIINRIYDGIQPTTIGNESFYILDGNSCEDWNSIGSVSVEDFECPEDEYIWDVFDREVEQPFLRYRQAIPESQTKYIMGQ